MSFPTVQPCPPERPQERVPARLWLAGPAGEQLSLPGMLWPQGLSLGGGGPIFFGPMEVKDANRLCELWQHPLGPSRRPFRQEAWGMAVDGRAVAVAIAASTISSSVETIIRPELVDLARIAYNPDHRGVLRAMLRLWRDYLGPKFRLGPDWHDTAPRAAASYALPGKAGNLYRFDGWLDMGPRKPWAGGATWSNPSAANRIADGIKRLWMYPYDKPARELLLARRKDRP